MDVYSNVLYVQINQPELAQLAHQAFAVDKYRVETCCIVGESPNVNVKIMYILFEDTLHLQEIIMGCGVNMRKQSCTFSVL